MEKTKSQIVFDAVGTNLPPKVYETIASLDDVQDGKDSPEAQALLSALSDSEKEIERLKKEIEDLKSQLEGYRRSGTDSPETKATRRKSKENAE